MSTIFDKILDGEIPCHRVYEDEHVLAFLDIGPLSPGHTLVIPKERVAHMHELSEEAASRLGAVLPKLCRAVMKASGASAYNLLQNNGTAASQVVMHVHVHIIPRFGADGLSFRWDAGALGGDDAKAMIGRMQAALAEEA